MQHYDAYALLRLAIYSAFITRSSNTVVLAANGGPSFNAVR